MNDRSLSILEQYDINTTQIHKGRGGFIIESNDKNYFFTEYQENIRKLDFIYYIQTQIQNSIKTDILIKNKENQLYTKDKDETVYILKEQPFGKECNYKNEEEIISAFQHMSNVHRELSRAFKNYKQEIIENPYNPSYHSYIKELEKHTNECRHIKKYLLYKNNKTEFERTLLKYYDHFLDKAYTISAELTSIDENSVFQEIKNNYLLYHGDFQYHNILFYKNEISSIHYEHISQGSGIKDFCYLFRKINEKNNWNIQTAENMLKAYTYYYSPSKLEWLQMKTTLSYPIKFWKIVNFYYNNRKSWISQRNLEKLSFLLTQEKQKDEMIKTLF